MILDINYERLEHFFEFILASFLYLQVVLPCLALIHSFYQEKFGQILLYFPLNVEIQVRGCQCSTSVIYCTTDNNWFQQVSEKVDVIREEYGEFYKSLTNDWEEHLA